MNFIVEKVGMLSRVREISLYLIGIVIAVIGVIIIGVDVSAIDEPKCEGENSDWFNICVGGSYRTYDPMDPLGTDYKGSLIDSTEKVRSDGSGNYYTEGHFSQRNIDLEIKGKELWIYAGRGCQPDSKAVIAKVPFKENIADFRNDVQKAIGGKEWTFTCDGPYMDTDYIVGFSSTNIFEESETEIPGVPVDETTEGTGGVNPNCINSGAANTLGWIVCPLLDWMSDASQTLYEGFVEPALQTDPQLFTNGPNEGTRSGWETFRNLANVAFIILFLFVIFSQITGVGIDNYGIKKILPKLIISAILINLSYWICLVFIDLSNIVGNSIQQLFEYMGNGLSMPSDGYPLDLTEGLASTNLTSVVVFGLIAAGVWGVVGSQGIGGLLLMLFVAAISVVVSLFFLFVILAAREAAIVVLVVLSPLAFVCYMLPNTKTLFDRWLKLGKALLLVYPIAGLLVGGGNFVSQLLLVAGAGNGGFFSAFMAMIVGVAPIFFIPTVLKNSFQGLGNIGVKLLNLGRTAGSRLGGATDRGVRNSERFKSYQADVGRRRQARDAQRVLSRYSGVDRSTLSARQQQRLLEAEQTMNAQTAQRAQASVGVLPLDEETARGRAQANYDSQEFSAFQEVFDRNNRNVNEGEFISALSGANGERAAAALTSLMGQGGTDEALSALSGADWENMNPTVRNRVLQTMASSGDDIMRSFAKYKQTGGAAGFREWADGTYGGPEAPGVKDRTLAQHLSEMGTHALEGYDKDQMKFIQQNAAGLRANLGDEAFGQMLGNAAVNSRDARAQTVAENMIRDSLANGNVSLSQLGITAEQLGTMRRDTAEAILQGTRARISSANPNMSQAQVNQAARMEISTEFADQINSASGDNQIRNRMDQGVRDIFGVV